MKTNAMKLLFACLVFMCSCKEKSHEHEGHDETAQDVTETSGNQELYNEVMKIHDEVMPKMNDIHATKMDLKERLEKTPNIGALKNRKSKCKSLDLTQPVKV
jgi:hypothetical protein